jgi:hypothetical protein
MQKKRDVARVGGMRNFKRGVTMTTQSGTALDLLEREDRELRSMFVLVLANQGPTVDERAEYGNLAKTVVRKVATREAAIVDVQEVVADVPELGNLAEQLVQQAHARRQVFDRVEKMSRGVQGISLNTGQDFDSEFTQLLQIVGSEIEWDLDEAIPAVRSALEQHDRMGDLSTAGSVARRAPTNLNPGGPRWYERSRLTAPVIAFYDRLRDYPKAVRER